MKITLVNQRKKIESHLKAFSERKECSPAEAEQFPLKKSSISVSLKNGITPQVREIILGYKIFPTYILDGFGSWQQENRLLQAGDCIVQQAYLPPFGQFSVKTLMGVRVTEVIDRQDVLGFSYATLEGHPEQGISHFLLCKTGRNWEFSITTHSRPSSPFVRIAGSVFLRYYQNWCTQRALKCVKLSIEK